MELDRAEQQIEDLKIQLDDAMGAEDMLEQLTERNLTLNEVRSFLYLQWGVLVCADLTLPEHRKSKKCKLRLKISKQSETSTTSSKKIMSKTKSSCKMKLVGLIRRDQEFKVHH